MFVLLLYIEGVFFMLFVVWVVFCVVVFWECSRGMLRMFSDVVVASVFANVMMMCFVMIVGVFVFVVFEVNFLGGMGVFMSCFVLFMCEIVCASANTDLATSFGVAMSAKCVLYVIVVILVFLGGCNLFEVLVCLYVGNVWVVNGIVWVMASDGTLA